MKIEEMLEDYCRLLKEENERLNTKFSDLEEYTNRISTNYNNISKNYDNLKIEFNSLKIEFANLNEKNLSILKQNKVNSTNKSK